MNLLDEIAQIESIARILIKSFEAIVRLNCISSFVSVGMYMFQKSTILLIESMGKVFNAYYSMFEVPQSNSDIPKFSQRYSAFQL